MKTAGQSWFSERWAARTSSPYWRALPIRNMGRLLAAAFILSCGVGFAIDLLPLDYQPLAGGSFWPVYSGTLGTATLAARIKRLRLVPVLLLLLESADRVLPDAKEPNMYATLALLSFDGSSEAEYSLAGHPPILHYSGTTRDIARLATEQLPLGLMPGGLFEPACHLRSTRCVSDADGWDLGSTRRER